MMKTLLKEKHRAKAHADAARAMRLAFFEQLGNFEVPLEEWERIMSKIDVAKAALEGRQNALFELLVDDSCRRAFDRDANYRRMKDSWFRYRFLLEKVA